MRNKYGIFMVVVVLILFSKGPACAQDFNLAAETLCSFAQVYLQQGRYLEAKAELRKCLLLDPQNQQAKKLLQLCDEKFASERQRAMASAMEEAGGKIKPETQNAAQTARKPATTPLGEESLVPPVQRGAWTLKEGQMYVELYTKYYWNNHQFDNKGKKKRWDYDGKGNEWRTELKLEYGLTDMDTLLLYTVAKEAHWKDSFRSSTKRGITEIWPGIKRLLFEKPFIASLQGKLKIPLNYSEEAVPSLGTHQIDAEVKILTAQPWPKLPGYTKFETGFRARREKPSNEIPYFFELGYNLKPKLILKTTLDGNESLAGTGGTNEDWLKYTIGPIFKISELFNLELGFGHTFYGKNTSAAKEIFCSISSLW
ncbi:MAG: tetratricopeptide repeat protein [Candidatus Omnitrophota bacterium]